MGKKVKHTLKTIRNKDGSQTYSRGKTAKDKYKNSDRTEKKQRKRKSRAIDEAMAERFGTETSSKKMAKATKESKINNALRSNVRDNFDRYIRKLKK